MDSEFNLYEFTILTELKWIIYVGDLSLFGF